MHIEDMMVFLISYNLSLTQEQFIFLHLFKISEI